MTRVSASGGTDITKAIEAAIEDVEARRLKSYVLHVVTDREDENFNPVVVRRASTCCPY